MVDMRGRRTAIYVMLGAVLGIVLLVIGASVGNRLLAVVGAVLVIVPLVILRDFLF